MNARAIVAAAVALLSVATTAVPARAQIPAPTRVALAFHTQADNAQIERWLVDGLEMALKAGKVELVDAAAGPDVVIDVSYWLYRDGTATPGASVVAIVDRREVKGSVPGGGRPREQQSRWESAGKQLGSDICLVLSRRRAPNGSATIDALLVQMAGRDPAARAQAADQVGRMGPQGKAAIPALVALLGDETPLRAVGPDRPTTVAEVAAKALLELGAHVELFGFARSKADQFLRAKVLQAIAFGRSPESPDVILGALDDRSPTVRSSAAGLAGAFVGRRAVPKLIKILEQESTERAGAAARESLTLMAGKDLGLDPAAWRQWWGQQERRQ
jgi:hypothetical protein